MSDLVEVRGLNVCAPDEHGAPTTIVRDVSFTVPKGEVLALIGESGSGKTTIALALMGYARGGCRITEGQVRVGDTDVLALDDAQLGAFRGARVAYIAQSAAAAFNPAKTLMDQVIEPALIHRLMSRRAARQKAVELFRALALPAPATIGRRYPHQVSGGQLQRLMAAMALITDPALVILDEPTTALDVTTQIEALRVFKKVVRERGATAVYVSHDLAVVAQMADRIVVLKQGTIRETGRTEQVLQAPADDYTQSLMAAARPRTAAAPTPARAPVAPVLEVRGLSAGYGPRGADGLPRHVILRDIDLRIAQGATLGVIGESGSGKSTLARVIAGLLPAARGEVLLNGEVLAHDLAARGREQLRRVQIVFQNADTALNPAHSVRQILRRPLDLYGLGPREARDARVLELLDLIRLPAALADRRAVELSGGQKQRINLARALAAQPDLILCDEVTSALDTVVAAAILELIAGLRRELGVSVMFISHDIATVRAICDEVSVLYAGRQVERGPRRAFSAPPHHPYTDLLMASAPEMRPGWLEAAAVGARGEEGGARPARTELCAFLGRCPVSIPGACDQIAPPRVTLSEGPEVLCHHSEAELRTLQARPLPVAGVG
ncbi:MAG: oligopeptide/dipeptide transporter ATPase subunit [Phenylobacterium sp.]|nr:oligopeptide/dipeptide transporter ATPase subunit [Phenylobacterium sp.]